MARDRVEYARAPSATEPVMGEEFKGQESDALQAGIALYMEATEKSREVAVQEIQARLDERREAMTWRDIEERNYTYVAVVVQRPAGDDRSRFERFLVSSPHKEHALVLAKRYVAKQGWQLVGWSGGDFYSLYPRNYVRESRQLFADGKYL